MLCILHNVVQMEVNYVVDHNMVIFINVVITIDETLKIFISITNSKAWECIERELSHFSISPIVRN